MTPKPVLPAPTDAELEILAVLWQRGPATVREIHTDLEPARGTGYTTILKLLQIMTAKGLVTRDESAKSHVYRAAAAQERTQAGLVGALIDRAFGGSAARLVQRALDARRAAPEELAEIRRLLDAAEARTGTGRAARRIATPSASGGKRGTRAKGTMR